MNGIYINLSENAATFVGTDAHKLVKYESEGACEAVSSFILPKKPAALLKAVLQKEEKPVETAFDSKNAVFRLSTHTLVCRLIEGNYPNYNAVIPANNPNKGARGPHRTAERHPPRGRVLESDDQPHPHGHRRQQDRPHGAGHRLLGVGQRDDRVQLRGVSP